MGTTKTKRAEEKALRKGSFNHYTYEEWKKWIDELYIAGTGDSAKNNEVAKNFFTLCGLLLEYSRSAQPIAF